MTRICKPHNVSPREWFWVRVPDRPEAEDECWDWSGPLVGGGYAQFYVSPGVKVYAHRFAYEMLVGPIPDGLVIDHLCRNRRCVRPSHLEPVTNRENLIRGWRARKAMAANGDEAA